MTVILINRATTKMRSISVIIFHKNTMLHEDTATLFSNYNNSPVSFDLYTDKWKVGISKPLQ